MNQKIIAIIILILLGFLIWKFGFVKQNIYYERTAVPCNYSGCENIVQCPSGYTKTGCEVPGNCNCIKTVPCSVDTSTLLNQCGIQETVWTCQSNIWTFECISPCSQVITKACNPVTNEIQDYPNSCIPTGWTTDLTKCGTIPPKPEPNLFEKYWMLFLAGGLTIFLILLFQLRKK